MLSAVKAKPFISRCPQGHGLACGRHQQMCGMNEMMIEWALPASVQICFCLSLGWEPKDLVSFIFVLQSLLCLSLLSHTRKDCGFWVKAFGHLSKRICACECRHLKLALTPNSTSGWYMNRKINDGWILHIIHLFNKYYWESNVWLVFCKVLVIQRIIKLSVLIKCIGISLNTEKYLPT